MKKLVEVTLEKWEQMNTLGLGTVFDFKNPSSPSVEVHDFLDIETLTREIFEGGLDRLVDPKEYYDIKNEDSIEFKFYAMVESSDNCDLSTDRCDLSSDSCDRSNNEEAT